MSGGAHVRVESLEKRFPISKGPFRRPTEFVHAVDGITFEMGAGESLALVGESGCGKTTTGRLLVKLEEPTSGSIAIGDGRTGSVTDVSAIKGKDGLRAFRRSVQMIFQDPYESMNPRNTVFEVISEPMTVQAVGTPDEREQRVVELLRRTGLSEGLMSRYPHELSGGQRQRVALARALVLEPSLIVADEPTSMLDVSIRISIMRLMLGLAETMGVTYLYITHDLAVARYMSDRIAVMYLGKIVEIGPTEALLTNPMHPYTRALVSAVPVPEPFGRRRPVEIKGGISRAINPPDVCRFLERCPFAVDTCRMSPHPELTDRGGDHLVACHLVTSDGDWTGGPRAALAPNA